MLCKEATSKRLLGAASASHAWTLPSDVPDVIMTELVSTFTAPNPDPYKLTALLLVKVDTYVSASSLVPSKKRTLVATTTEPALTLMMATVTSLPIRADIDCSSTVMSCKAVTNFNLCQLVSNSGDAGMPYA